MLNVPEISERLSATGAEPTPSKPEEFDALIKSETVKWAKVIRSGVKLTN